MPWAVLGEKHHSLCFQAGCELVKGDGRTAVSFINYQPRHRDPMLSRKSAILY